MPDNNSTNQLRRETQQWSRQTANSLRRAARKFRKGKLVRSKIKTVNIRSNGRSFKAREEKLKFSIRSKVYGKPYEYPEKVRFNYAYHGFFLEKGIGPGVRSPQPWLKPVMDKQVGKLADGSVKLLADAAVKAIL